MYRERDIIICIYIYILMCYFVFPRTRVGNCGFPSRSAPRAGRPGEVRVPSPVESSRPYSPGSMSSSMSAFLSGKISSRLFLMKDLVCHLSYCQLKVLHCCRFQSRISPSFQSE